MDSQGTDCKPSIVGVSCAVAKSEIFWRANGQSNLADKRLAATKASKVWFSYSHNCTLASGAVFHSVCQVWLSRGPPEYFTFSFCAWLWNWLVEQSSILSAMQVWLSNGLPEYLLATAHDCETNLYGGIANSSPGSFSRGGPWGRGWWNCTFPQTLFCCCLS